MYGVVLHAHPVRGEAHSQRNTTGEVATVALKQSTGNYNLLMSFESILIHGTTKYRNTLFDVLHSM